MSEGKVNWNYTCPICKKTFPYCMFAGSAVRVCDNCKCLDVMINICPKCPYNKKYRIGIKCTKFKDYPYPLDECPYIKNIELEVSL